MADPGQPLLKVMDQTVIGATGEVLAWRQGIWGQATPKVRCQWEGLSNMR